MLGTGKKTVVDKCFPKDIVSITTLLISSS